MIAYLILFRADKFFFLPNFFLLSFENLSNLRTRGRDKSKLHFSKSRRGRKKFFFFSSVLINSLIPLFDGKQKKVEGKLRPQLKPGGALARWISLLRFPPYMYIRIYMFQLSSLSLKQPLLPHFPLPLSLSHTHFKNLEAVGDITK